jgi:hypothetical protein
MRLILKVKWDTPRIAMLETLNFQSVRQRIYFNTLKFIHRIVAGMTPDYMKNYLQKRKEKYDYNLRRKSEFDRPNFKKRISQNSLLYKGIGIYNEFRAKYKEIHNQNDLKRKLNFFVKENIETF